jgi:S-(hydroxymethyl)glutathione dehydrogenase/alcohol dehydrogenase
MRSTEVRGDISVMPQPARAVVFHGVGSTLRIEDVLTPPPADGEVRLDVAACGACLSDVHKIEGHGLVEPPCVFGHENSGTVSAVGPGIDHLAVGDRVVCSFLVPCGRCPACADGREDECGPFRSQMQRSGVRFDGSSRLSFADGTALRTSGVGGLATAIVMPATSVFRLPDGWPDHLPLVDAAVLGCAGLTGYGAVHRAARLARGEHVAVLGAGGVGLCIVAFAKHAGAASVLVTDMKPDALDAAKVFGATATSEATAIDLQARVTEAGGGAGPSVVFDTIGNEHTIRQALGMVAIGGRVVVTGLAGTSGASIDDVSVLVRRKVSLIGSYAGVPGQDMPAMLVAVAEGALDPSALITARYGFDDAADAYTALASGAVTGRAVIEMPPRPTSPRSSS